MVDRRWATLRKKLDALRERYETPAALALDPLSIPMRFPDPLDRELIAWVAAHLAYGRVAPMLRGIEAAIAPLGTSPASWLRQADLQCLDDLRSALAPWKWRFHTGPDLFEWLLAWRRLDQESGAGIEPFLAAQGGMDADAALSRLIQRLRTELAPTLGTRFTLPDPGEGAACKRWRMFLRWMVRPGWPDFGLWTSLPTASLVIPLDTHVARVSRFIGLTGRATPDGRMALEITESLRNLDADDPLKYDFALSHLGILGDCPGLKSLPACRACPLVDLCSAGKKGS